MKWRLIKLMRRERIYSYLLPGLKGEVTITLREGFYTVRGPKKYFISVSSWWIAKKLAVNQVRKYDQMYPGSVIFTDS